MTTPLPAERVPSAPDRRRPPSSPIHVPADVVAVLEWPREAARRADLASTGRPRLLVLAPDGPPPLVWDEAEDWIRSDADPVEVEARTVRLALLAPVEPLLPSPPTPVLDADGVLRGGDGHFAIIPAIEARILHHLLERPRELVRRDVLEAVGWPARRPPERALDGCITRLRGRVRPFGIHIRTVRGTGHLVELDPG